MAYYKCGGIYTTQNSNVVVDTASGAIANFNTSLALPLKLLNADVNAVQDLHGYDHPWVGGAGKNKVDWRGPQTITSQTTLADYATSKQTQYTVSIYAKNTGSINARLVAMLYNDNTRVVQQVVNITPSTDGRISVTLDTTSYTYNKIRITISGQSAGYEVTVSDLQVEEGSTATDWTPYENICPITGHDEVNIYHSGEDTSNPDEITITLGQTVYGGEIVKDKTGGALRIIYKFLDLGLQTWTTAPSGRHNTNIPIDAKIYDNNTLSTLKCSNYKTAKGVYLGTTDSSIGMVNLTAIQINDSNLNNVSPSDFKTAMSGVQLVYELATPIEIPLSDLPEIVTKQGINNIWVDSGDISVQFRKIG